MLIKLNSLIVMKKITLMLAATILSCSVLMAQKPATSMPDTDLSFKETTHDFGKIPQGKPVTTIFEATNTTKAPITLTNVVASCGCTTPAWKPGPYKPGEKFPITVGYNAANPGSFNKTVTIMYGNNETQMIYIKGTVEANVDNGKPMQ